MSNHRPGFVGEPLQWVDVDDFEVQPASSASGGTTEQGVGQAERSTHSTMQCSTRMVQRLQQVARHTRRHPSFSRGMQPSTLQRWQTVNITPILRSGIRNLGERSNAEGRGGRSQRVNPSTNQDRGAWWGMGISHLWGRAEYRARVSLSSFAHRYRLPSLTTAQSTTRCCGSAAKPDGNYGLFSDFGSKIRTHVRSTDAMLCFYLCRLGDLRAQTELYDASPAFPNSELFELEFHVSHHLAVQDC